VGLLALSQALKKGTLSEVVYWPGAVMFMGGILAFGIYQQHGQLKAIRIDPERLYLTGICYEFLESLDEKPK
jgi:hypothetical protein